MDDNQIKYFVEAALLAAGGPLSIDQLQKLFDQDSMPEKSQIRQAISGLLEDYEERGLTVKEVASGFRIQVEAGMAERLQKLWEERPPRDSRALFETLALIAYRQPMTRGEIEEIRGVSVSSNIIRSLMERDWIRVVGHRDIPGRPEMFGTTRQFLDYFGLKKLEDLPPLADLADWESLRVQLNLPAVEEGEAEQVAGAETGTETETAQADTSEAGPEAESDAGAEVSEVSILEPGKFDDTVVFDAAEAPSNEDAEPADDGVEPIEATEWPDPDSGNTFVKVLDAEQMDDDEDRDDASVTGG
jgi:segregation and condensation protein B